MPKRCQVLGLVTPGIVGRSKTCGFLRGQLEGVISHSVQIGLDFKELTVSLPSDMERASCIAVVIKRIDLTRQAVFPGTLMYLLTVAWVYVYISVIYIYTHPGVYMFVMVWRMQ